MKMIGKIVFLALILHVSHAQTKTNIAETASNAGLQNLVKYAGEAGLVDTLTNGGPFTVFAPTNKAFNSIPQSVKSRMKSDKEFLKSVLLGHVVSGTVRSTDLSDNQIASSLSGEDIKIRVGPGGVTAGGARVVQADVETTNGVVHVIDQVILPKGSIVAELQNNGLDTLVSLATQANLGNTLSNDGPFTLFAPTDKAFKSIPADVLFAVKSDPQALRSLLLYHVLSGSVVAGDITGDASPATVEGGNLELVVKGNNVHVNDANVLRTDITAKNGVIHVVDKVLVPPQLRDQVKKNILNVAEENGFTTLLSLLRMAGLDQTVAFTGPFTVFAPTNEAFKKIPPSQLKSITSNPETLKAILMNHIIPGEVFAADLYEGLEASAAGGQPLSFTLSPSPRVNNVDITATDVPASNGVIHVVDSVIVPQLLSFNPGEKDIPTVAKDSGLTILVDLVIQAGLASTLSSSGPFTVFAPTNEAFSKLSASTIQKLGSDPELLKKVLTYHVLPANVKSLSLRNDLTAATVQGQDIRVNIYRKSSGTVGTINGARIVNADVDASNGVVHVIDKVLLPPAGSVADVLEKDPRLSTLNTAVKAAGLGQVLNTTDRITLFAPSNAAFGVLGDQVVSELLGNLPALKSVLLKHVVPQTLYNAGLCYDNLRTSNGAMLRTAVGPKNSLVSSDQSSGKVIEGDISATNGVVHIIDNVL